MPKVVKDIMNKAPKVIAPEEPLHKAATLMDKHEISYLPVVDHHKQVLGHVHTHDVVKAVAEQKPHTTPVKHIMKKAPVLLAENTPIEEVANQLAKAKVKGAPIVNEKKELTGFVHVRDIEDKVPNSKLHVEQICNACKHHPKKAA